MSEASVPGRAARRVGFGALDLGVVGAALVALGAALCFLFLTYDYYSFEIDRSIGRNQAAALAGAVAIMFSGAALEIWAGRRTLSEALRFWLVAGQVALLTQLIRIYEIENRVFFDVVALLLLFGFIVNHHLSKALRPPFFFALGVLSILAVLGLSQPLAAAALIGLSLLLVGISSLPIKLWMRIVLLVAVGAGLAAFQAGVVETGWSSVAVPLLASAFAFRLIIFLYDIHNGRGPKGPWGRLGYFFLPPNPVFPFFPVVDYATMWRTYYNEDALKIYQRGAEWVLRGVAHLIVYRVIYLYLSMAPESVDGVGDFLRYIATNFGLYFRISGLFHMLVGLLLLFGFNLHETHSKFYFSNSFIDFWRRINIYWKDFMQKIFFNPAFVRLKKIGASHMASVVGAIVVTFVATWALHSYNWFWLRGSPLLSVPDVLFWTLLCAFLITQTLLEERLRAMPARPGVVGPRTLLVVRTACTLFTICLIWSMWTSPSLGAWVELLIAGRVAPAFAAGADVGDWIVTAVFIVMSSLAICVAMGITFGLGPRGRAAFANAPRKSAAPARRLSPAVVTVALSAALIVPQIPGVKARFDVDTQLFVESLSDNRLNARDQALMTRGYYEDLTNTQRFNSQLWELYATRPRNVRDHLDMAGMQRRPDYIDFEYAPGTSYAANGVTYAINRWGMRDRDYELAKPEGTTRIALIEASRASGFGVEYEQRYETLLEERLDAQAAAQGRGVEILNFAVDGYTPIIQLLVLEEKVWPFAPDAVVYSAAPGDLIPPIHIARMYRQGRPSPYPFVDEIIARAGVDRSMSEERIAGLLAPYSLDLIEGIYREFVAATRRHGATPIWFFMPSLPGLAAENQAQVRALHERAEAAGFVILELPDVFGDVTTESIQLGPWDVGHPNAYGHGLVANALYEQLADMERRGLIDLGLEE